VIRGCLEVQTGDLKSKGIRTSVPDSHSVVDVDPAELITVVTNLLTNATYWLGTVPKNDRRLEFKVRPSENGERLTVWLHDSGPGIAEDDLERVFWPGVTRRPDGSGMGLTLASELVGTYNGQMRTMYPGELGGASFAFDVPRRKARREAVL
jgi:C4-dicarboxylate-specific signal transduction histidine kinase